MQGKQVQNERESVALKLVWQHLAPDMHAANSAFGTYRVLDHEANWQEDRYEGYCTAVQWMCRYPSLADAQAAAQSDFEKRVSLCLPAQVPAPDLQKRVAELEAELRESLAVIDDYLSYKHDGDPWSEDARLMGEMDINDYGRDGRRDRARAALEQKP